VPKAGAEAILDAGDPFARDLLDVLQLICPAPSLVNGELPPGDRAILRPDDGSTAEPGIMRTTTSGIDLRFFYKYDVDPEGGYLRIQTSTIGLSLTPSGRCLLRVEYDREKGPDQPDAHVHVDADGALWGKALTLSGQPLRPLHTLHIPAGGRRFRPTMEDFVEFLLRGRFVTPTSDGWRDVLRAKRAEWEERQARAAARRHESAVADTLRGLGWTVHPPPEGDPVDPNGR